VPKDRGPIAPNGRHRLIWTGPQRHYALALLCLVAIFNLMDRQIMAILLEPIRKEFGASDTQMGLLTGTVFAAFYALASIPLARAADRYPRGMVIGAVLGFWSVMTMLGGLAASFTMLVLTRIGVALGEAGSSPASYAMVADLYPLRNRAKALSFYVGASSVGMGSAVLLGGWLAENFGWRTALVAVGLPGILLALVVWFTLYEPRRGMSDPLPADLADTHYSFGEALKVLWASRTYRCCVLIMGFGGAAGFGVLTWGPTFLMRVHGLSATQTGAVFGAVSIGSLVLGQLATGVIADWAGRRDLRAYMWCAAAGSALAIPCGLLFVAAGDWRLAMIGFGLQAFFQGSHSMCAFAIGQSVVPPRTRGTASMIATLASTLFGMGLAPLFIGVSNDLLAPIYGLTSIRYSLGAMLIFPGLLAVVALLAAIWVRDDYARLNTSTAHRSDTR
jgi:MFS family permease